MMITQKKLAALVALLFSAITTWAVPVAPWSMPVRQSDGTTLTVRAVGDEWWHCLLTTDGLVVTHGADGDLYYSMAGMPTAVRAHNPELREAEECDFILAQKQALKLSSMGGDRAVGHRAPRRAGSARVPQVQPMGRPHVPVIMVQYPDKLMSSTVADFERHFYVGETSARQYFADQSNGLFDPQFDLYGIYTLPSPRARYGTNDSHGNDAGLGTMVMDAITMSGNTIDWSRYDNDGDGEADVCIVVYAGVGEAQATGTVPSSIWPCQWSLSEAQEYGEEGCAPMKKNGVVIDKFAVFNEVHGWRDLGTELDGIGTFCHEFSHCLGLPDFYPTVNVPYYGMGSWSLMDEGCYNDSGHTPVGYSAYEKNYMDWLDYTIARNDMQYTLPVLNHGNDMALKVVSPVHPDEYYILENRARQGWDSYIRDEGVLITHVTYVANRWSKNTVNNGDVQLMTIFAANNDLSTATEDGDLYGHDNHELTDSSVPAAQLFMEFSGYPSGKAGMMGKPVTEIYLNSDGSASLWFARGFPAELVTGDVTGDGRVDVEDVNAVINVILGIAASDELRAASDVTGDGRVDVEDVNAIINVILG